MTEFHLADIFQPALVCKKRQTKGIGFGLVLVLTAHPLRIGGFHALSLGSLSKACTDFLPTQNKKIIIQHAIP